MLQFIVSGIAAGSIYGLIGLGLVLIHKATNVVNFAQGEMVMITTFIAWTLVSSGVPIYLTVLLGLVIAGVFGFLAERLVIHPFLGEGFFTTALSTLGLFVILGWAAVTIWGADARTFPPIFPPDIVRTGLFGGVSFAIADLGIIAVTALVSILLWLFFKRTTFGMAMRATADNAMAARLVGVNVSLVNSMVWVVAGVVAGLAGLLVAPLIFVSTAMMVPYLLKAFASGIIGGFDSLPGALLGGVLLGVTENVVGFYSSDAKTVVPFLLLVLLLLVRPQGLFGKPIQTRV